MFTDGGVDLQDYTNRICYERTYSNSPVHDKLILKLDDIISRCRYLQIYDRCDGCSRLISCRHTYQLACIKSSMGELDNKYFQVIVDRLRSYVEQEPLIKPNIKYLKSYPIPADSERPYSPPRTNKSLTKPQLALL